MAEVLVPTIVVLSLYFAMCWFCYRWGQATARWQIENLKRHMDNAQRQKRAIEDELADTRAKLLKAQRNDTPKDPKTGKFKKRAK